VLRQWPTPDASRPDHENGIIGLLALQRVYQSRGFLSRQTARQADRNESKWAKPLSEDQIAEILVFGNKNTSLRDGQRDHVAIGGARTHAGGRYYVVSCRL